MKIKKLFFLLLFIIVVNSNYTFAALKSNAQWVYYGDIIEIYLNPSLIGSCYIDYNQPIKWESNGATLISSDIYTAKFKITSTTNCYVVFKVTYNYSTTGTNCPNTNTEQLSLQFYPSVIGKKYVYPNEQVTYTIANPCNTFLLNQKWSVSSGATIISSFGSTCIIKFGSIPNKKVEITFDCLNYSHSMEVYTSIGALPSTPANLVASNITKNSYRLSWNASTDVTGITGYQVLTSGGPKFIVTTTYIDFTGLNSCTSYSAYVAAVAADGEESFPTDPVTVQTELDKSLQFINGPDMICPGLTSSAVYTISSPYPLPGTYTWKVTGGFRFNYKPVPPLYQLTTTITTTTPSVTVYGSNSDIHGTLTVTFGTGNYCQPNPKTLVNHLDDPVFISSPSPICKMIGPGEVWSIQPIAGELTYHWSFEPVGSSPPGGITLLPDGPDCRIKPEKVGDYLVKIYVSSYCGNSIEESGMVGVIEYNPEYCGGGAKGSKPDIEDKPVIQNEVKESFNVYPNPFKSFVNIEYGLSKESDVKIYVCNLVSAKVAELVNEVQDEGTYKITYDGSGLNPGVYFITIQTDSYKKTEKVIMIK